MQTNLSKFNKFYVSRLSENRCFNIRNPYDSYTNCFVYSLYANNTSLLQRIYDSPTNFSLKDSLISTNEQTINSLSNSQKNSYTNYKNVLSDFVKEKTFDNKYKYSIYPTSLGIFIKNNFLDLPPIEKKFIMHKLTGKDEKIATRIHVLNCTNGNNVAVLLVNNPLNKDEHSHLINEWKEDYTFQGVKNALKKIQSIIDLYSNEYSHVVNAFSEMVKDNEKLLKENKILKDEVLRVSKTTWN